MFWRKRKPAQARELAFDVVWYRVHIEMIDGTGWECGKVLNYRTFIDRLEFDLGDADNTTVAFMLPRIVRYDISISNIERKTYTKESE